MKEVTLALVNILRIVAFGVVIPVVILATAFLGGMYFVSAAYGQEYLNGIGGFDAAGHVIGTTFMLIVLFYIFNAIYFFVLKTKKSRIILWVCFLLAPIIFNSDIGDWKLHAVLLLNSLFYLLFAPTNWILSTFEPKGVKLIK